MSTQAPPLAYAPHADPIGHAVWTGLRVATVAWAVTIVVRHLAYWSAVAVPGPGMGTARGLAMAEAAVLAAMAIVAVIARVATPSRVRTLAILGAVVIALSLVGFAIDLSRLPPGVSGEKVGRIVWMAATRLQVQALPIAWIVATFARR